MRWRDIGCEITTGLPCAYDVHQPFTANVRVNDCPYFYTSSKYRDMFFRDRWGQRILASALGFSAIMLSASVLVASIKWGSPAQAEEWNPEAAPKSWDEGLRGAVGLGIHQNHGYFIIWSQPNQFYKVDLSKARDWYED